MAKLGELFVEIVANTKKFDGDIKKAEKALKKAGQNAVKFGANMTKYATLPILAAGAASIKFAADAEEANAKFNTAFKGIEDRASETAKTFAKEFGVANQTSEKLLGNTGDLLKGFGATADGALDFSLEIQKLAVDLASYNNIQGGAERASRILTKSVMGNKDGLVELGVSLLDVDIKQELVRTGQDKLTGQAGKLAKSQAVFNLILQQTGDAQGDYARTADSATNQTRLLAERSKDLAVAFGNELLPMFTEIASKSVDALQSFAGLDDGTKRLVIGIAAVTAGIGPAIKGIKSLGLAFKVLGAAGGPVALVALSITGIIAGIKLLKELRLSKLEEEFGGISNSAGLSAEAISDAVEAASLSIQMGEKLDSALKTTQENYDINRRTLLEGLLVTGRLEGAELNRVIKEIDGYKRTEIEQDKKNKKLEETRLINEKIRLEEEAKAAEIEALRVIELATLKQINDQKLANIQSILDSAKTETEVINEQIAEVESLADANGQLTADQLEAIEILNGRKLEILDEERIATKTKIYELEQEEKESRERDLEDAKKAKDKKIAMYTEYANHLTTGMNSIATIAQNLDKAEAQRLDEKLKADIKALEKKGLSEEEFNTQKRELEKETAKKKYELELKAFNTNKAIAVIEAGIATALGIAKSLPNLFLAGTVGALGALQVGAIISQPEPPKPAFAQGGVVKGATEIIAGEKGQGEVLLGMNAEGDPLIQSLAKQIGDIVSSNSGGRTTNFYSLVNVSDPQQLRQFAQSYEPYAEEYRGGRS